MNMIWKIVHKHCLTFYGVCENTHVPELSTIFLQKREHRSHLPCKYDCVPNNSKVENFSRKTLPSKTIVHIS
ncbi:hypothetical protein VIGAN_03088800 [Vigna angularis var. angularis]|uniref:Uncharacterized protein n=1 Tax=Vigna angularis var. angularis TaxID=157739 RepID=A0A0S3RKT3_PHAAN|nr:hypothetical protein VIGAN_03088800 [Vigna angularis var. angularis]